MVGVLLLILVGCDLAGVDNCPEPSAIPIGQYHVNDADNLTDLDGATVVVTEDLVTVTVEGESGIATFTYVITEPE